VLILCRSQRHDCPGRPAPRHLRRRPRHSFFSSASGQPIHGLLQKLSKISHAVELSAALALFGRGRCLRHKPTGSRPAYFLESLSLSEECAWPISGKSTMKKVLLIISTVVVSSGRHCLCRQATRVKPTVSAAHRASRWKIPSELAPDVTFKDLDGKDATLPQYKAKSYGHFWATWCDPCYVEFLAHREQQKYEAKGSRPRHFYGRRGQVPLSSFPARNASTSTARNSDELSHRHRQRRSRRQIRRLSRLPHQFLISRDGKIVKKVQGLISYENYQAIESQL